MLRKIFVISFGIYFLISCTESNTRKIRLSETVENNRNQNSGSASVIKVSPDRMQSIAILYFENQTNDSSLEWLRRGLGDMIRTELSQSPYLNIIGTKRLAEIARKNNSSTQSLNDRPTAILLAREAQADIIVAGKYFNRSDSIIIEIELIDTENLKPLSRHTKKIQGLEKLFTAVDEIAADVKNHIHGQFDKMHSDQGKLAQMTKSIEAFRCYSKAMEYYEKFFRNEAIECLEKAINEDSTFASAYLRLAMLRFDFGSKEDGMRALEKARKFKSQLSKADEFYLRMVEARVDGNRKQQMTILQEAVQHMPYDVDLRLDLARLYRYYLNDLQRSLEEFQIVLEMDPGRKSVYNDLGYLYAFLGDFETALKFLRKYQEMAPDEPNPYDSMGEILMQAGRLNEAIEQYQKAWTNWPSFFNSAMMLSYLEYDRGNYQKAVDYGLKVKPLLQSEKLVFDNLMHLSEYHWKAGKIAEAHKVLAEAKKIFPYSMYPRWYQQQLYEYTGDSLKAEQVYRDFYAELSDKYLANPYGFQYYSSFFDVCLLGNQDVQETLSLLSRMESTIKDSAHHAELEFVKALQLRKAGMENEARLYLEKNEDLFFDIISSWPQQGWRESWQQITRLTDHFHEPGDLLDKLIEAGKQGSGNLHIMAKLAKASAFDFQNETQKARAIYKTLGVPAENLWAVAGPFRSANSSMFSEVFPVENNPSSKKTYKSGDEIINWHPLSDQKTNGLVELKQDFERPEWSTAYARIIINSPSERKAQIRIGSSVPYKIWLNDELVWQFYQRKDASPDKELVTVALHPGHNTLMIKSCYTIGMWAFYLRVTDEHGNGFPDIQFITPLKSSALVSN